MPRAAAAAAVVIVFLNGNEVQLQVAVCAGLNL